MRLSFGHACVRARALVGSFLRVLVPSFCFIYFLSLCTQATATIAGVILTSLPIPSTLRPPYAGAPLLVFVIVCFTFYFCCFLDSYCADGAVPVVQEIWPEASDHVNLPSLERRGGARHERTQGLGSLLLLVRW